MLTLVGAFGIRMVVLVGLGRGVSVDCLALDEAGHFGFLFGQWSSPVSLIHDSPSIRGPS
jgi:hypothetical protein